MCRTPQGERHHRAGKNCLVWHTELVLISSSIWGKRLESEIKNRNEKDLVFSGNLEENDKTVSEIKAKFQDL